MEVSNTKHFYNSPQIKVMEIKSRQIVCASPNGTLGSSSWNNQGTWDEE